MGEKIKKNLEKTKKVFIVAIVLWVFLSIVLVSPITVAIIESTDANGIVNFGKVIEILFSKITSVGENLGKVFTATYISMYWKVNGYITIALLFFTIVSFIKTMPKHEYSDIEHGSSDWSKGREAYKILNSNKGILLAENYYLPVDKRGNTNVLVVGRFRFW